MELFHPAQELTEGYRCIISPRNSPLRWLELGRLYLPHGAVPYYHETGDQEVMVVVLGGTGRVEVGRQGGGSVSYDLSRRDVFSERATMVYIPPNHGLRVTCGSAGLDVCLFRAPADRPTTPFLIGPKEIEHRSVGQANWRRDVYLATQRQMPIQRLIVGETVTPPGNWSSYPAHKHDVVSAEGERPFEELFFYLVKPRQGYGIQQLYDSPEKERGLDATYVVRDGDALAIPHGYHPVVAAAGYQLYYLWALAGETLDYGTWSDDPTHAWLRDCEPILSELDR